MNFRTTYILFAAVAVLLVAFFLIMIFRPSGDADDYLLMLLHEGPGKADKISAIKKEIDRLEIERLKPSGEALAFVRKGDGWKLESPYEARVDKDVIERVVSDLVDARIDKNADMSRNLETLGLASPSAVITLKRGGKDSYRIVLGNLTTIGRGVVFAQVSDRGREPVAIPRSALDGLFRAKLDDVATAGEALKSISDFRPRNLLAGGSPIPWDTIQRVGLEAAGKQVVLQKADDGTWRFLKPEDYGPADLEGDPQGPAAENIAGVRPLLTALTGFRISGEPGDIIENPPSYNEFGVEEAKASLIVQIKDKSDNDEKLVFGKTTDKDEKIFARLEGEKFVVKLPAKALEPIKKLIANPVVMRDRNLAAFFAGGIDAINVSLRGEKTFELRRAGTPPQWRVYEPGSDSYETANGAVIQELLNKLTEHRIVKEFPDSAKGDAAYGLEEPAVELAIWQNGIVPEKKDETKKEGEKKNEPEKKPELQGKATLKLLFGKREKDLVYVRRIAPPLSTLVAAPESLFAIVSRPRADYLDLTLPSFDFTKVSKVAFNRDAEKIELEKIGDKPESAEWKILLPAALAGTTANANLCDQVVDSLRALHADKIVAAKATDADLERFGLKPPRIEATVTLKDSAEKLVFQFGNETDDKQYFYARFGGKDRVYRVARVSIVPLLQGEIQDLTIFRVDPKKVTSLKMTGWKDVAVNPVTLEFTRKSPIEWSCKQDDKDVDSAKVERFIDSLSLVRADRFVSRKGSPTPEQKLTVDAGALAIELSVEGEKEPITLTVGATDMDGKTRFAISNKSPGGIFLLYKERFDEVKLPTWFKKEKK